MQSKVEGVETIAYAATITLDCSKANMFNIGTLTGNVVFSVQNLKPGQTAYVLTTQDGTGSRLTTWNGAGGVTVAGGLLAASVTAAATNVFELVGVTHTTAWMASNNKSA
jgi:hypothetical protein